MVLKIISKIMMFFVAGFALTGGLLNKKDIWEDSLEKENGFAVKFWWWVLVISSAVCIVTVWWF